MNLELKIPPVVVMLTCMLVMFVISSIFSSFSFDFMLQIFLVIEIVFSALAVALAGVYSFSQEQTTVNPVKPKESSKLVTSGIYKFTRNPMYLGMAIALVGFAVYLGNILSLIGVAIFVVYMNKIQILPEEKALQQLFGEEFIAYKERIKRWIL